MASNVGALTGRFPRSPAAAARYTVVAVFFGLLALITVLPRARTSFVSYPAVSDFWVLVPFAALFILPVVDPIRPWRSLYLDLLALLAPFAVLGLWSPGRPWSIVVIYAPLVYIALRMGLLARGPGRAASALPAAPTLHSRWLIVGIVILAAGHVSWTVKARATSDGASASFVRATHLVQGQPLYGVDRTLVDKLAIDPHF